MRQSRHEQHRALALFDKMLVCGDELHHLFKLWVDFVHTDDDARFSVF